MNVLKELTFWMNEHFQLMIELHECMSKWPNEYEVGKAWEQEWRHRNRPFCAVLTLNVCVMNRPTNWPTNRPTDQWIDTNSYGTARPHLEILGFCAMDSPNQLCPVRIENERKKREDHIQSATSLLVSFPDWIFFTSICIV